jgi:NADH/F420H2 dehydrogenase subunit C
LIKRLTPKIKKSYINDFGELELEAEPLRLFKLLVMLKEEKTLLFEQLIDITAIDYPNDEKRFKLIYNLFSIVYNQRVRVFTYIDDLTEIKSLVSVYPNASWYEREIFDMFGIIFADNLDLRRILTDVEFKGHPLRKDFPLKGTHEIFFNEKTQAVEYRPL